MYILMEKVGITNVGLSIILFTIVIYAVNNISDTENTSNYGTGSYPPFEKGLHLIILQSANATFDSSILFDSL